MSFSLLFRSEKEDLYEMNVIYISLVRNNSIAIACFRGLNIESHIASGYYFLCCFALGTIRLL